MNLAALRARLEAIQADRRAIHEAAGENALNDEQQTRWSELDAEETELRENIRKAEEAEARANRVAESRAKWKSTQISPDRNADPTDGLDARSIFGVAGQELRSRALSTLDEHRDNTAHFDDLDPAVLGSGDRRAQVEKLIRRSSTTSWNADYFARMLLLTETPAYRSGFRKMMGGAAYVTPDEARALDAVRELRAALSLTDGNGGYAVPTMLDPTVIWTAQGHPNDFMQISRVENITTDKWNGVASAGATAYWGTEGTAVTDGSPTFTQPTVQTQRLTVYVPYSFEIAGDWAGFAAEVANAAGFAWNEKLVSSFTNGTGVGPEPMGLITKLKATVASQVASQDSGSATAPDVYNMWAAEPIKFRRNSRWMSSTAIENAIRQAGTTDPNFTVNLTAEGIPTLFARPFHENDYMDGVVLSTSSSIPLVLGDFRHFLIANRVGMTFETVQHVIDTTTGTPTGQRAALFWGRIGSDVTATNAFRVLSQS